MDQVVTCKPGLGLRAAHYAALESAPPRVATWFEGLTENCLDSWGQDRRMLEQVRMDFPVSLHGVSLSIGSAHGLRIDYLAKLRALVQEVQPFVVSDHLCWTASPAGNSHDLLPLPYTQEALELVISNVDQVQFFLGREIALENPSSYFSFLHSEFSEWEFLVTVAKRTGAKILLDINNVYVSARNHGYEPMAFLRAIPPELVVQIHLAGFTDMGDFLFDTHSRPVHHEVWDLFRWFAQRAPTVPFMIEWDEDVPDLSVVETELARAVTIWKARESRKA